MWGLMRAATAPITLSSVPCALEALKCWRECDYYWLFTCQYCCLLVLAKHCTIVNILQRRNRYEMQDALYLNILIWGLSHSWLEWKKILHWIISKTIIALLFDLKKKSALLPPRNLPTPLLQKSNGLSLSDVAVLNEKVTFWAFCLWWDNGSRESFPHTLLFPSWASSPPNVAHNDAENMCQALKFCNKAKTLQLFFAPL